MILFNIFKVIIGTYFQLSTSRFIANDNSLRMKLQCGDSPHLIDRTFNQKAYINPNTGQLRYLVLLYLGNNCMNPRGSGAVS